MSNKLPKLSEIKRGDAAQREAFERITMPFMEGLDPASKDDETRMTGVLCLARKLFLEELERRRDAAKDVADRKAYELLLSACGAQLKNELQAQPQVQVMAMQLTLSLIDIVQGEVAALYLASLAHPIVELGLDKGKVGQG